MECVEAAAPVAEQLTEIERELRVVVSLSVGDEVDLVLPALLLKALLGTPVLTHTAACENDDQSPDQPEPWREAHRKHVKHTLSKIRLYKPKHTDFFSLS